MATNSAPAALPTIHHLSPSPQRPQPVDPVNPTLIKNPITKELEPVDFAAEKLQFAPKNNTITFSCNQYGVVVVQLNRPSKMNAFNLELIEDLYDVLQFLRINEQYFRCVVVKSSNDKYFSAGLDIMAIMGDQSGNGMKKLLFPYDPSKLRFSDYDFNSPPQDKSQNPQLSTHNLVQHVCVGWQMMNLPVIMMVSGLAIGIGFQIILGADIRIMTPTAKISVLEAKWGLIPDCGLTALSRNIISDDKLKLLSYTTQMVSGKELIDFNIATLLTDNIDMLYSSTNQLVTNIIFKPPQTVLNVKRNINLTSPYLSFLRPPQFNQQILPPTQNINNLTILNIEQVLQTELLQDPNQQAISMANVKGKLPRYTISPPPLPIPQAKL